MELNQGPRNKPIHLWSISEKKAKDNSTWERSLFNKALNNRISISERIKLEPSFFAPDTDLNLRVKTIKLLQET
jgi:hypothetical protein